MELTPGTFVFELWTSRNALLNGLGVTLLTSALSIAAATLFGLLLGVILTFGWAPLRWLARLYVDVLRGIPLLVLILFTYYGLALFGLNIAAFWAGVVALAGFATAHVAENFRGAVTSIPVSQMEAAKAIGLPFTGRLRYVILPQAVRRMLPPWVNTALEVVKGTTLLSIIGVVELLLSTQQAIARNYMVIDFYLFAAAVYIVINFGLSQLGGALERRFAFVRY
jgi:polar amino acid transport system permease protein